MLEPDAPDISPAWIHPGRNSPDQLPAIGAVLGQLRGLTPQEVQGLGEAITKMKQVTRERVHNVLHLFTDTAADQSMPVSDTDEYFKAVLRKAPGADQAHLLIDRIMHARSPAGTVSRGRAPAGAVGAGGRGVG